MSSPKKVLSLFAVIAILCGFLSGQQSAPLSAAVPRLVNYSGRATDAKGAVIAGVTGVTFSIYKEQYEGAPLWVETQNVATDSRGIFNVQLGATRTDGIPTELFTSGEARWLGVRANGGEEQPRLMLLSVPYALKAADAETLGGLPASAFVLAAPTTTASRVVDTSAIKGAAQSGTLPPNSAVTGLGTAGFLPLWDASSDIVNSAISQSGSGTTAKVGIGTSTPLVKLEVGGATTIHGNLSLPSTGLATAAAGKVSQPATFTASVFNKGTGAAVPQNFRWLAKPKGNNTIAAGATLDLLFGAGSNPPQETGLQIASSGQITFANGQTFPGAGTISGVTAGVDLVGGGTNGNVTLNVDLTKVPQLQTSNNFSGDQDIFGNLAVTGSVGISDDGPGVVLEALANSTGIHAPLAIFGSYGNTDSNSILVFNGTGKTELFQSGCPNCFVNGALVGDGGMRVTSGKKILFGDSTGQPRLTLDSTGNASQPRAASGTVKAMLLYDGFSDKFLRCFNSTLSEAAATTLPCGFSKDKTGVGDYIVDFGFQVDDRFFSLTNSAFEQSSGQAADQLGVCIDKCTHNLTPNQLEITTLKDGTFVGAEFWLIVY